MAAKPQKIVLWDEEVRDTLYRVIAGLRLDGKRPWMAIIKPFYESPSDRQRGYYRSTVLKVIAEYTGYTDEEVHEWCKQKFGPRALVTINGEAYEVTKFTTSNEGEIAAMTAYMHEIKRWAASELALYIPPPRGSQVWE